MGTYDNMTISLALDDGDFTFTGPELASDLRSFEVMLGWGDLLDRTAKPAAMIAELTAVGGAYFEGGANEVYQGQPIRLRVNGVTLFTGHLRSVRIINKGGVPRARIEARGRWDWIASSVVDLPIMFNVTTGYAIEQALTYADRPRPIANGANDYGFVDRTHVDGSLVNGNGMRNTAIDDGVAAFAFVGDSWSAVRVGQMVNDLVVAEFGLFYEDAAGRLVFRDRSWLVVGDNDHTISDPRVLELYTSKPVTDAKVAVYPRDVQTGATIWTLVDDRVCYNGTEINARWQYDGKAVGITGNIQRVGWAFVDNKGNDVTDRVQVQEQATATGVKFTIAHMMTTEVKLQAGASCTGDVLVKYEQFIAYRRRSYVAAKYGTRAVAIVADLLTDEQEADNMARFLAYGFGDGGLVCGMFGLDERDGDGHLDIGPGDQVGLTDAGTSHSGTYIVANVRHRWTAGQRLESSYGVLPLNDRGYTTIGVGTVDSARVGV
jgi:hypothetical protein